MSGAGAGGAKRITRFRAVHHLLGAAVLAAWGLAMTRLAVAERERRAFAPELTVGALLGEAGEARAYYGIYQGETKVGYAASHRSRAPGGGWLFADQAVWRMELQGVPQRLVAETSAVVDDGFGLKSFKLRVDTNGQHIAAEGRVEGNELWLKLDSAARSFESRRPIERPPLLPAMVRAAVVAKSPKQGDSFVFPLYNPLSRETEDIEVVVEGRETLVLPDRTVDTWRVTEILRGSIRSQVWIDDAGDAVRETSPIGLRIESEPREKALAVPEDGEVADLVFAVAVPVEGDLSAAVAAGAVRLKLLGIDPAEFPLLAGGRQTMDGDILTTGPAVAGGGYPLPYVGGDFPDELASEPLVQSSDPAIVEMAKSIVPEGATAEQGSRALYEWVFKNVRKRNSAGVPSAVEVLEERSGDCNEHTVLYVALARAAGIPARIAVGLVWANARGGGPGLYYHAWPEVWLGRSGENVFVTGNQAQWFALDPTLGQYPADAGHLRFLVGGLDEQVDLLKLIGKLRVKVEAPAVPKKKEDKP